MSVYLRLLHLLDEGSQRIPLRPQPSRDTLPTLQLGRHVMTATAVRCGLELDTVNVSNLPQLQGHAVDEHRRVWVGQLGRGQIWVPQLGWGTPGEPAAAWAHSAC